MMLIPRCRHCGSKYIKPKRVGRRILVICKVCLLPTLIDEPIREKPHSLHTHPLETPP